MGKIFKICMFITSFIPLWLTITILLSMDHMKPFMQLVENYGLQKHELSMQQFINNNDCIAMMFVGIIIIINIICTSLMMKGVKSVKEHSNMQISYKIIGASREKTITSEYLLSYILPLFAFDFSTVKGLVSFFIYFIILGFLCVKNNNVYANLIFELQGYSFYNCNTENAQAILVISKSDLCSRVGHTITLGELNKPVHIDIH